MSDFTSTGVSHELCAITEVPASSAPEAGASCTSKRSATAPFSVSEVETTSHPEAGASCAGAPPAELALETV